MKKRKLWVSILAGVLAAVMLLSLVVSLIPAKVSALSSSEIKLEISDLKASKAELEIQMEEVQNQYEANENEIVDMVNQKNVIDQEIFLLHGQIDNINQQLAAYALLIADKQDELDSSRAHLVELNEKNKERVRAMEEDGKISYWAVLFKANSFSDLLDRLNMIDEIAASDYRRLQEMSAAAERVAAAQKELESEKKELDAVKEELDATQAVLDQKRAEADQLLNDLIAKGYELEDIYAEYQDIQNDLLNEIAAKEKEYNEAKHQEWLDYMSTYTTVPPETPAPAEPGDPNAEPTQPTGATEDGQEEAPPEKDEDSSENEGNSSGGGAGATWLVPCSYRMLTSPFGQRPRPTAGASTFHQGVDLAGPEGTPIYASRSGVVTKASKSRTAGYHVSINHGDGYSSIYMHMTHYVVSKGQAVSAGQLIGYMGSTGISTGSHLHFGIAYDGKYVNPANFMYLHP